jgi:hypothetical protein
MVALHASMVYFIRAVTFIIFIDYPDFPVKTASPAPTGIRRRWGQFHAFAAMSLTTVPTQLITCQNATVGPGGLAFVPKDNTE